MRWRSNLMLLGVFCQFNNTEILMTKALWSLRTLLMLMFPSQVKTKFYGDNLTLITSFDAKFPSERKKTQQYRVIGWH